MIKTKDKGHKHSHIKVIDKKHHFRSALLFPHMKMALSPIYKYSFLFNG